jgi:hypothetical protein
MLVDVVTAAHAPHAGFVASAWDSLRAQTMTDWSWSVQIDGPPNPVLAALAECGAADNDQVQVAVNGTQEGPAVSRNVALGRSRAPLVQNLDVDDKLEPDALATLAGALADSPDAGFAFGHARDLLPNGDLLTHPLPLQPGLIPRGQLVERWAPASDGYRVPAHPAGVMWRRSLLLVTGGWPALHRMEDTGLLMSASALAPAILVDKPTLQYRKHSGQVSANTSVFEGGCPRLDVKPRRGGFRVVTQSAGGRGCWS